MSSSERLQVAEPRERRQGSQGGGHSTCVGAHLCERGNTWEGTTELGHVSVEGRALNKTQAQPLRADILVEKFRQ